MAHDWSPDVLAAMQAREIGTVCTIPDGGLTRLLQLCREKGSGTRPFPDSAAICAWRGSRPLPEPRYDRVVFSVPRCA